MSDDRLAKLSSDDINWLIWALGFVAGAVTERDKADPARVAKIETRCRDLAIKLADAEMFS